VPHVNIKHFPADLTTEAADQLVDRVTEAVTEAFGCDAGVVSVALEPVAQEVWQEQVYDPEITGRKHLLRKVPNY
jgi:4-oxalocrotonate tautomerase